MHVILYRGIAGSGKTYCITKFIRDMPPSKYRIHSADSYRYVEGVYKYDPKTDTGHMQCFRAFIDDLLHHVAEGWTDFTLIVDNTNTNAWEIAPYMLAATSFGCTCEVRTVWCDPEIAARRNKHQVPFDVILKMQRNILMADLPPFWKHTVITNEDDT